MKKIIPFVFLIFIMTVPCWAIDLDLSASYRMVFFSDESLQQGQGIEIRASHKSVYLWGSYDSTEMRLYGQRAGKVNIIGAGLGLKIPLTDQIKLWFQGGYYFPESKMEGEGKFEEAQWLQWRQWGHNFSYNTDGYRIYEYDIKPNLGGAAGLEANFLVYKNISLSVDAGYHFLRFKEQFWARNPACPDISYIETRQEKDFSGFTLGLNLTWRF